MCSTYPFYEDFCIVDGLCRPLTMSLLDTLVERLHLCNVPTTDAAWFSTGNPSRHCGYFALCGKELYLLEVVDEMDSEPALMYSDLAGISWKTKLWRKLNATRDGSFRMPTEAETDRILTWFAGGFNRAEPLRVTWLHDPEDLIACSVAGIPWGETSPESWISPEPPPPLTAEEIEQVYEPKEEPEWITRIRAGGWLRSLQ
jgi:hypothetical protein